MQPQAAIRAAWNQHSKPPEASHRQWVPAPSASAAPVTTSSGLMRDALGGVRRHLIQWPAGEICLWLRGITFLGRRYC
jgi:hypothetical protein